MFVEAGQADTAALRDRGQREPVEPGLVGDRRGGGRDPLPVQPHAGHAQASLGQAGAGAPLVIAGGPAITATAAAPGTIRWAPPPMGISKS